MHRPSSRQAQRGRDSIRSRRWTLIAVTAAVAVVALQSLQLELRSRDEVGPLVDSDWVRQPLSVGWERVAIDGGGFMTGVVVGPGDRLYARSDVGGAYRRDPGSAAWTMMTTSDAVIDPEPADYSVAAVAVSPSDADTVYLAVGDDNDDRRGRVLWSRDGGETFGESRNRWRLDGNDDTRRTGERLAVDPNDPEVVWLGTQDGLWRSTDGGRRFRHLDDTPGSNPATSPGGVTVVQLDESGPHDQLGHTMGAWAGIEGVGVVRTEDGGQTWTTVLELDGIVDEMEVDDHGDLVVVSDHGLWRISGDDVTDIAPARSGRLGGVAIHPSDPMRMFVSESGMRDGRFWRSDDGGRRWDRLDIAISSPDAVWPPLTDLDDWMSVGELVFDSSGTLWFAEGMGMWRTDDLDDHVVTWIFDSTGIDNTVANDAARTPGGPLITAHWDRGLFVHGTAAVPHLPHFNSAWSLATTPADAGLVVAVIDNHQHVGDPRAQDRRTAMSQDGGRTWKRLGSLVHGQHPAELKFGNIAVSSTDPRHFLWLPSEGGRVHVSTDAGDSWQRAEEPAECEGFSRHYLQRHVLTADPVDGRTFYFLCDDGLARSTDGGWSWDLTDGRGLPEHDLEWNATVDAAPGHHGLLFAALGPLAGDTWSPLLRSDDGGESWAALSDAPGAGHFGFGAPLRSGGPPVLWAEIDGQDGRRTLARSADLGETFQTVTDRPLGRYDHIRVVRGDPTDPDTVYVGYAGTGFIIGHVGATVGRPGTAEPTTTEPER